MNEKPEFVDNLGCTMADALRDLAAYPGPASADLDVATAYFNLGGFEEIEDVLWSRQRFRLLLGAEPRSAFEGDDEGPLRGFGSDLSVEQLELRLSGDRDALPFNAATAEVVVRLAEFLRREGVEVRRFAERFLHGKVYLFRGQGVLAGSHNLTRGGLRHNLEVSVANYNPSGYNAAAAWFEGLWDGAEEYRERLLEILTARETLTWTPHDIYLRALLELYRDELGLLRDDEHFTPGAPGGVSLTEFQRHGVQRALSIIERWDGVIVGDGVGLGKSYIGSKLLEHYVKGEGLRALVLVPAALRDSFWQRHVDEHDISAKVMSYQELASEKQLGGTTSRMNVDKDEYRFVLVDEAHAFRNPDTDQYRALSRLMGGARKKLCMMTATPVNNGVFDLYHQIMLFARHTARFSAIGIPNLTEYFKATAEAASRESAAMFGLMDSVSVRRTRRFIQKHYPNATLEGKPIRFPRPRLRTVRYDLDAIHPGLFERVAAGVDALTMARYRPDDYRIDGQQDVQAQTLAGILRTGLLKRFESSVEAFRRTVQTMSLAHETFLAGLDAGGVLGSRIARDDGSEENDPAISIGDVAARPLSEYRIDELRGDVEADLAVLRLFAAEVASASHANDPKLEELARLLRDELGPEKAIVFSLYADTIDWIEQAIEADHASGRGRFGNRRHVSVTGTSTATTRQRLERVHQFCPVTTAEEFGAEAVNAADEKDLLLTTDVLAEGQNLQQARYIINYDMPWNPMRLVQRNGRIDRIGSPFAEQDIYLYNLFPGGDLDRILRLYETLLRKIGAANVTVGMESPVFEDVAATERTFTGTAAQIRGIADEDTAILDAAEATLDAFSGEEFRMELRSALAADKLAELEAIPHGAGSGFLDERLPPNAQGVFFAARLLLGPRPRPDDARDQRAWRYIDLADSDNPIRDELEMLERVRCKGGTPRHLPDGAAAMLYELWARVQAEIIDEHNERLDPAVAASQVPRSHLWAIDQLAAQTNSLAEAGIPVEEVDASARSLNVDRGPLVQRMLNRPRQLVADDEMSPDEAAREIIDIVRRQGFRPVEVGDDQRVPLAPERVRLICYQVIGAA